MSNEISVKYLEDGKAVRVLDEPECGGYVVAKIYTGYGRDWVGAQRFYVERVYPTPPMSKYFRECYEQEKKVEALLKVREEINKDIERLEAKRNSLEKKDDASLVNNDELC